MQDFQGGQKYLEVQKILDLAKLNGNSFHVVIRYLFQLCKAP